MLHDVIRKDGKVALICDEEDAKFIAYIAGNAMTSRLADQHLLGWYSGLFEALDMEIGACPNFLMEGKRVMITQVKE